MSEKKFRSFTSHPNEFPCCAEERKTNFLPIGLKSLKKVFAFHCRYPLSGYLLSTLKKKISDVSNKCLLDAHAALLVIEQKARTSNITEVKFPIEH